MKVKNISNQILKVVGVGVIKPDQEVDVPTGFNNANFAPVKKEKKISEEEKVEKKLEKDNK